MLWDQAPKIEMPLQRGALRVSSNTPSMGSRRSRKRCRRRMATAIAAADCNDLAHCAKQLGCCQLLQNVVSGES